MSTDSYQERTPHPEGAKDESHGEPFPEPESVIVDPQGNPYRHADKPYQKIKNLLKRVLEKIPHGERMMILLTAAVAFATFAQAGIAWYSSHTAGKTQTDQFNQMKSVADRMEGAAKSFAGNSSNINQGIALATTKLQSQADMIDKARKAADTDSERSLALARENANKSLQATIDNFHQEQRAWLSVKNVQISKPISTSESAQVTIVYGNTGRTPAIDVHLVCRGFSTNSEPVCDPNLQPQEILKNPVAPGGENLTFANVTPQSQQIVDGIKNKTLRVYFIFSFEYSDVYGGKTHHTTFCGYTPSEHEPLLENCATGGAMD